VWLNWISTSFTSCHGLLFIHTHHHSEWGLLSAESSHSLGLKSASNLLDAFRIRGDWNNKILLCHAWNITSFSSLHYNLIAHSSQLAPILKRCILLQCIKMQWAPVIQDWNVQSGIHLSVPHFVEQGKGQVVPVLKLSRHKIESFALLSNTPWRCMGEWRYSSTHS